MIDITFLPSIQTYTCPACHSKTPIKPHYEFCPSCGKPINWLDGRYTSTFLYKKINTCTKCPLSHYDQLSYQRKCHLLNRMVGGYQADKPKDCPLKQVRDLTTNNIL